MKTARNLHNQSRHHYDWGRYESALAAIRKAKQIIEELKGADDPLILTFLNDMAYYYRAKGELGPVQGLLEEVWVKQEEIAGKGSVDALLSAQALAEYLLERRLYSDALAIYEEVSAGFEDHEPGDATTFYRSRISRLKGNALALVGHLDEAEEAYSRALRLAEELFGAGHPKIRMYLSDQARFYSLYRKDYAQSEDLYKRLLAIVEADRQWPEHVWAAKQSLGRLYLRSGKYELGEELLRERYLEERADGILEQMNSAKLVISASNLGEVCWAMGDMDRAIVFWKESTDRSARFENSVLAVGTEVERLEYAAALVENINATLSLHLNGARGNALAAEMAFMRLLRTKGRVLEAQADTFRSVQDESVSAKIKEQFTLLNELRGQHAYLSLSESDEDRLQSVSDEIQGLERSLAEHSANLVDITKFVQLDEVFAGLPEKAALVEFVRYQPLDVKQQSYCDSHYAVYVLQRDGTLAGFDLGLASVIDANISSLRTALSSLGEYKALAATLHSQLVAPWPKP
ncbi:MAG: tetratricopeptide (TPR) repeat protein [Planctomycetota bacterium]